MTEDEAKKFLSEKGYVIIPREQLLTAESVEEFDDYELISRPKAEFMSHIRKKLIKNLVDFALGNPETLRFRETHRQGRTCFFCSINLVSNNVVSSYLQMMRNS